MNRTLGFNPFPVDFENLEAEHLTSLLEVHEGWYLDYKEEPLEAKELAKHLSSFANQYGGWLVFGVKEARNPKNEKLGKPESFPGLTESQVVRLKNDLDSAARQCVEPTPSFEIKDVNGPNIELGLSSDRSIVIVMIPAGRNTPYLHNSGRVYRRVGAQSDPVAITDRSSLQDLIDRAAQHRKKLKHFLEHRPAVSKAESENVYLHLYTIPVPLGHPLKTSCLSFEEFVQLARGKSNPKRTHDAIMVYEDVYTTQDGYIARHVANNDPYYRLTTWRYFSDFSSCFTFPVNTHGLNVGRFPHYEHWDEFVEICHQRGLKSANALDLIWIFACLADAFEKVQDTLAAEGLEQTTYFKLVFENVWRKVPFLDSEVYLNQVRKYGLPIIQDEELFAPPGIELETLGYISKFSDETASSRWSVVANPMSILFQAVGIPIDVTATSERFWLELFDALNRNDSGLKSRQSHE